MLFCATISSFIVKMMQEQNWTVNNLWKLPLSHFSFVLSASDTDNNHEVLMTGRPYPSIQEFASAIPNHLLLGSLLEHLCFVYESNPARSRMLFKGMYWDFVLELEKTVKLSVLTSSFEIFWDYCLLLIPNSVTDLFFVPLIVIGQRLAAMNLLSPLAISDEFSTVRLQHNRAFTELLHAANSSLYPQVTGQNTSVSTRCLCSGQ